MTCSDNPTKMGNTLRRTFDGAPHIGDIFDAIRLVTDTSTPDHAVRGDSPYCITQDACIVMGEIEEPEGGGGGGAADFYPIFIFGAC
jgi:hypothetical protein